MSVNRNRIFYRKIFKDLFFWQRYTPSDEVFVLRMIRVVSLLFTQQAVIFFFLIGKVLSSAMLHEFFSYLATIIKKKTQVVKDPSQYHDN